MNHRIAIAAIAGATVFALNAPADAAEKIQPVNEGGDYQACVTYQEFSAVYLGMPMRRAERIMDTKGHREPPSAQLHAIADFLGITLSRTDVYKTYPMCETDDVVVLELNGNSPRKRIVTAFAGVASHS